MLLAWPQASPESTILMYVFLSLAFEAEHAPLRACPDCTPQRIGINSLRIEAGGHGSPGLIVRRRGRLPNVKILFVGERFDGQPCRRGCTVNRRTQVCQSDPVYVRKRNLKRGTGLHPF